ncbi:lipase maturation factor family protein, partial [Candidatus Woesearchaeota archaeon]|nr:lipase maturation factor family protein [Candidatus Woesearchaeota archaeon]
ERAEVAKKHAKISRSQNFVSVIVFVLMIYLSIPVVQNLLSSSQRMNSSFDRLHLLNTYGAFGSITKERHELVFEGSMDGKEWKEYEFYAKPTDISKRPSFISPYHYRLDWQLWFASMQPQQQNLWILKFVWRLLNDDKETLKLIAQNPFPEQSPKFIRVLYYKYEFAPPKENVVWKRSLVGLWLPPVAVENFHTD